MVGYDGLFPESARILTCLGADLIVYPTTWTEDWEPALAVRERAAENHVSLVAAARLDSPVQAGSVIIQALPASAFSSALQRIEVHQAHAGQTQWLMEHVDVAAARNKVVAHKTDVLAGRRAEHWKDEGLGTRD
jgi:predicted amidohydrolase